MFKRVERYIGLAFAFVLAIMLLVPAKVEAYSDVDCFDFGDTVMSINAGESKKVWFRSDYNYTYFVGDHTSDGTYIECTYRAGSEYMVVHIGPDETVKNVFFHFYVNDARLESLDVHDCIEVYVQNIVPQYESIPVAIAGGKTGTLMKQGNTAMLYNDQGTAMASFSISSGNGNMGSFGITSVVNNGSNYFAIVAPSTIYYPKISESDKAVMIANGYSGICVNGIYKNW